MNVKLRIPVVPCPYCGTNSRLIKGADVYPRSPHLADKDIYRCAPCDALVGCHPGTINPLGTLANAELRKARMAAHAAFDPKWKNGNMTRRDAYTWLADQLGYEPVHIGESDIARCKRIVEVCQTQKGW